MSSNDDAVNQVQVVAMRQGDILLTASPRPCEEPDWQLPSELRLPGEDIDATIARALGNLYPHQALPAVRQLGTIHGRTDLGKPVSSLLILVLPDSPAVSLPPGTSQLWRSVLSGPPEMPGLDHLLGEDPEVEMAGIVALWHHIAADKATIPTTPESSSESEGLRKRREASRRRNALLTEMMLGSTSGPWLDPATD